jgi:hypothetical protein
MKMACLAPGRLLLLILTPIMLGFFPPDDTHTNQDALVLKEFNERITKYVELHKNTLKDLPKLKRTTQPAKINASEEALALALRQARPAAQAGDIFFPDARRVFLRLIRSELKGPQGSPGRAAIKDGNPKSEGTPVRLAVNAVYPDGAPLSSVPPAILLKLPQLPKELDYRFVGRHLILRDTAANIIVDYIIDAAPAT